MTESVQKFISACDELIDCKFLVAEHKIGRMLGALAGCEPVYALVGECMEQFNRDREMSKAFVQAANGSYVCIMPNEEFKIVALVFCTLADINAGKIDFNDFVKRFFADEPTMSPYRHFVNAMIIPFRNILAEAFGLPKVELNAQIPPVQEISQLNEENAAVDGDLLETAQEEEEYANLMSACQRIANQILDELTLMKQSTERDELETICYGILMATAENDVDYLYPLVVGLKHAAKGVRAIKFLVREIAQLVEGYAR